MVTRHVALSILPESTATATASPADCDFTLTHGGRAWRMKPPYKTAVSALSLCNVTDTNIAAAHKERCYGGYAATAEVWEHCVRGKI